MIDNDGTFEYSKHLHVYYNGITGVDGDLTYRYELQQNYPNPFNPVTTINYSLASRSEVKLSIFNIMGELLLTLEDSVKEAGQYDVKWNASYQASGVYILKMTAVSINEDAQFNFSRKMTLVK